jgi:hypothetical protein
VKTGFKLCLFQIQLVPLQNGAIGGRGPVFVTAGNQYQRSDLNDDGGLSLADKALTKNWVGARCTAVESS